MPDDLVSLCAEYRDGVLLGYTVTARGGDLTAHCPSWAQALVFLTHWSAEGTT